MYKIHITYELNTVFEDTVSDTSIFATRVLGTRFRNARTLRRGVRWTGDATLPQRSGDCMSRVVSGWAAIQWPPRRSRRGGAVPSPASRSPQGLHAPHRAAPLRGIHSQPEVGTRRRYISVHLHENNI